MQVVPEVLEAMSVQSAGNSHIQKPPCVLWSPQCPWCSLIYVNLRANFGAKAVLLASVHPFVYMDRQTPPHTHTHPHIHTQPQWAMHLCRVYIFLSFPGESDTCDVSPIPTALGFCFLWASSNPHAKRLLASPSDMPRRIWILALSPAWAQAGTSLHSPSMLN